MKCRHPDGYCLKIYEANRVKIFVDDRGCAKCKKERNGEPKMPQRKGPPLTERLKTAMAASKRIRRAVKRGEQIWTNKAERQRRREICDACEYRTEKEQTCKKCGQKPTIKLTMWCLDCGCWLPAKQKLATEDCALGFWGPEKPIKEISK